MYMCVLVLLIWVYVIIYIGFVGLLMASPAILVYIIIYINSGLHAAGSAENVSRLRWTVNGQSSNFHIFSASSH